MYMAIPMHRDDIPRPGSLLFGVSSMKDTDMPYGVLWVNVGDPGADTPDTLATMDEIMVVQGAERGVEATIVVSPAPCEVELRSITGKAIIGDPRVSVLGTATYRRREYRFGWSVEPYVSREGTLLIHRFRDDMYGALRSGGITGETGRRTLDGMCRTAVTEYVSTMPDAFRYGSRRMGVAVAQGRVMDSLKELARQAAQGYALLDDLVRQS